MSAGAQIDYDALAAKHGATIDYDALAAKHGATATSPVSTDPLLGAAQATGIGPDTRGPFRKVWDEVKRGLTAAQPGEGLKPQPTTLASAAQYAGMVGTVASQLMPAPEAAAGSGAIERALPSTERAGKVFQELKGAIGDHSVHMTDRLANALADVKDAVDTGSTLPSVINKFVNRITSLEEGPLTYKEARQFYSNVSDLSASERMASKGNDLRLIQEFKHALGETISSTAENAGRLQQYQGAMSEFASAKRMADRVDTAKNIAIKAIVPAVLGYGGVKALGYLRDISRP